APRRHLRDDRRRRRGVQHRQPRPRLSPPRALREQPLHVARSRRLHPLISRPKLHRPKEAVMMRTQTAVEPGRKLPSSPRASRDTPLDWPAPGPIDLRVHDLPHTSSALEWWYVNTQLETAAGRKYG